MTCGHGVTNSTYLSTNPLAGLCRSCVQLVSCRYGLATGPTLPPPLAILVLHGFLDQIWPRVCRHHSRDPANCDCAIGIGIWYGCEALCRHCISHWRRGGWRLGKIDRVLPVFSIISVIPLAAACAGLLAAFLWSVAGSWFFPSALPQNFHLTHWQDVTSYMPLLKTSFLLAGGASLAALLVVLAWSYAAPDSTLTNRWLLGCILCPFSSRRLAFYSVCRSASAALV